MELVEGKDLSQRIARGAIPVDEATAIANRSPRRATFAIKRSLCMMSPEAVMRRFILLVGLGAALLVAGACDEQPPDSPLIQAARTGALDTIKLLLNSGADVNLPGPTGDDWDATPLQHAILARQSGAVRLLLDRGADPNRVAGAKAPAPLLLAAGDTDPTFVNLLLAHGADPDHRRRKRSHAAVSCGLGRHDQRTGPPDVRRLPRRNGACAARARSRASLKAQCCREQRDLVGALPEM